MSNLSSAEICTSQLVKDVCKVMKPELAKIRSCFGKAIMEYEHALSRFGEARPSNGWNVDDIAVAQRVSVSMPVPAGFFTHFSALLDAISLARVKAEKQKLAAERKQKRKAHGTSKSREGDNKAGGQDGPLHQGIARQSRAPEVKARPGLFSAFAEANSGDISELIKRIKQRRASQSEGDTIRRG